MIVLLLLATLALGEVAFLTAPPLALAVCGVGGWCMAQRDLEGRR